MGSVTSRILQKWQILLTYYESEVGTPIGGQSSPPEEDTMDAKNILDNLKDPLTHLYLTFVEFILKKLEGCNEIMQAVDPIIPEARDKLTSLAFDLSSLYMTSQYLRNATHLSDIDFENPDHMVHWSNVNVGDATKELLRNLELPSEVRQDFMIVCRIFISTCCVQLQNRINYNNDWAYAKAFLNPKNALSPDFHLQYPTLDHAFATFRSLVESTKEALINEQWRLLLTFDIPEEIRREDIVDRFWGKIEELRYTGSNDQESSQLVFKDLISFVDELEKIPNSNASCERGWSKSNRVKPKIRNRLRFGNWRNTLLASQYIVDQVRGYLKNLDLKNIHSILSLVKLITRIYKKKNFNKC